MWIRQFRDLIGQYRQALLIAAAVVAIAWPLSRHLNNGDEASRALVRVYDNTPHFEWRLVEKPHPTR